MVAEELGQRGWEQGGAAGLCSRPGWEPACGCVRRGDGDAAEELLLAELLLRPWVTCGARREGSRGCAGE